MINIHPDFPYPLYLVLTEENCVYFSWIAVARQALEAGVKIIQLREKKCTVAEYIQRASELKKLTDQYEAQLIINDSLEVALAVKSWGIHVGQNDTPPHKIAQNQQKIQCIGWSIENEQQLTQIDMQFVHYLGISPVFSTQTKTDTITEWGIEGVKKLRNATNLPLVAIGGIHLDNAQAIIRAGANSIAVVSAICASKNPYLSAQKLQDKIYGN